MHHGILDSTDEPGADAAPIELAQRALAGEAIAWGVLVRRHSPRVRLVLLAMGVPLDAVDDLVQESWVRLVNQQRAGRLESLELPGLAIAQARWLALEHFRTHHRREQLIQQAGVRPEERSGMGHVHDDPEASALDRERWAQVQQELARCAPNARKVFESVYGARALSHAEAAREAGLSLQRVRQILCEVRARLRRVLLAADR